jgi:hypothetical protein
MKYVRAALEFIWKWFLVFPARINIFWGRKANRYWDEHYAKKEDPSLAAWNDKQGGKML